LDDRTALAVAVIVVLTALVHLAIPLPADVAWLSAVNEQILDGRRLYADILESNPPMGVWLYWLPVALERLTGIAAEPFIVLETLGAGLLSLWLAGAILRSGGADTQLRLPLFAAVAAALLVPVDNFAQREHFVLFALLPSLALAVRRAGQAHLPAWAIGATGLSMALAVAVKPQYALVALMLAASVAFIRRSWRPLLAREHLLAAGLLGLYALLILTAAPAFWSEILPAAGRLYVPLRLTPLDLMTQPQIVLVLVAAVAATIARREATRPPMPLVWVAILGCLLVYLIQGKGWSYHALPALVLALLATIELTLRQRHGSLAHTALLGMTGLAVVAPMVIWLVAAIQPEPLLAALAPFGRGRSLAVISADIGIANPAHRLAGDRLVDSAPMLWEATGSIVLQRHASPADLPWLKAYEDADRRALAGDLERASPDLILADTGGFNWLDWARREPRIAIALEHYALATTVETHGTTVEILRRTH